MVVDSNLQVLAQYFSPYVFFYDLQILFQENLTEAHSNLKK